MTNASGPVQVSRNGKSEVADPNAASGCVLTEPEIETTTSKAKATGNAFDETQSLTTTKFVPAFEKPKDFHWVDGPEPHAVRRQQILAKYPQIKELFGYCPKTKYIVAAVVALQTYLACTARLLNWPSFFLVAYIIGGTCNHAMMMAMHELSHNMGFKKMIHNRIFSIFANLPIGVPSAISFKRYHTEHHKYQGEDSVDMDLPCNLEGYVFANTLTKAFFIVFQVFFYALRPLLLNPKQPCIWELYNLMACMTYNFVIYKVAGGAGLFYLLLSTFLGSGAHPVAGHFISEHYEFILGYETYSYYGVLNYFTFNVGLHNEHHDFPNIPGSRLHLVRQIAPEFYDPLPKCESWVGRLVDYIFNPNITAFSRVKRHKLTSQEKSKLKYD